MIKPQRKKGACRLPISTRPSRQDSNPLAKERLKYVQVTTSAHSRRTHKIQ
jgi:hypothetical protein